MSGKLITWRRLLAVPVVLVLAIQLVPVSRQNPPVTADVNAPEPVAAILRRACYDCHSNETRWPWYAYVAPVSWTVADHVEHGRVTLNFSTWDAYDLDEQRSHRQRVFKYARAGLMPLQSYLRHHEEARLSNADITVLERWAASDQEPR